MKQILTIQSRSHPYDVYSVESFSQALQAGLHGSTVCLADRNLYNLHRSKFDDAIQSDLLWLVDATEEAKSYEAIIPIFHWLLKIGMKRSDCVLVVGGGVLQDIGCFISSILFRGIQWQLVPTTLLAQCDSCIGSKSSINIASYKNQIGTFYPPHRVILCTDVLDSLPYDELRSGIGEAIKLHLLAGDDAYEGVLKDLKTTPVEPSTLFRTIESSLRIKQKFIEVDEFDLNVRNLLNYGHTFGHAYESATKYGIPHGIAVTLGIITATFISAQLGMVDKKHFQMLKNQLRKWHEPYGELLKKVELNDVLAAMKFDKKSTRQGVNCILTRGPGRMEKMHLTIDKQLGPMLGSFFETEV